MTAEPLTILIADDHPLFRKGLRALLATLPSLSVAGEAASGPEAVAMVAQLRPQLVLLDLHMPSGDGLSAIRQIVAQHPSTHILVVTMFEDDDSVFAAMRARAARC